jgi:hypothetical protein
MIKDPDKPFSIKNIPINKFYVLGTSKNRTQILFISSSTKNDVTIDTESVLQYGSSCKCYPVLSMSGIIVGSLLIVVGKFHLKETHLSINKCTEDCFSVIQAEGVGGLLSFIDVNDNLLILPYSPNTNKLTVTDRGQND